MVAPDKLRFDFTNKAAMTAEQIKRVEDSANAMINKNEEIYAKEAPLGVAKTIQVQENSHKEHGRCRFSCLLHRINTISPSAHKQLIIHLPRPFLEFPCMSINENHNKNVLWIC